jgi:tetratricopeptide (TPR) repeat protein
MEPNQENTIIDDRSQVHFEKGNEFKEQGEIELAIENYQKSIQIKPDYIQPVVQLAEIYQSQENWSEATKCYQRIVGLRPDNSNSYLKMAKTLQQQGKITVRSQLIKMP